MIRVLRPTSSGGMVSARSFEQVFGPSLAPDVAVESVPAHGWLRGMLPGVGAGDPHADRDSARAFIEATAGFDFLCPDYQVMALSPMLAQLRNLSGARVRLLLIAHAPGATLLEWALLAPLISAGDRIIAPSRSALRVIDALCPVLTPFVRVIPHPIAPLDPAPDPAADPGWGGAGPGSRCDVVSLSRIHRSKLLHRQIDAVAILRDGGLDLTMRMAGPLAEAASGEPTPYARSLMARIRRLGLEDRVHLIGEVSTSQAKASLLRGARLLVNLSATTEESFGKSAAEALSSGVPVVATRWDGLPETVGAGGECVPITVGDLGADVAPEAVAAAMRRVLEDGPTAEQCRCEAERSSPSRVRSAYRGALEEATEEYQSFGRAPGGSGSVAGSQAAGGLLALTAPLTTMSWPELFELHRQELPAHLAGLSGTPLPPAVEAGDLRALLYYGTRRPLESVLAGASGRRPSDVPRGRAAPRPVGDFLRAVATAAASPATLSSRIACAGLLADAGRVDLLRPALAHLRAEGIDTPAVRSLQVELYRQVGEAPLAIRGALSLAERAQSSDLAAPWLRQLASVARDVGLGGLALPWLRAWLGKFPDAPDSGMVWLERCLSSLGPDPGLLGEARAALDQASELLGSAVDLAETRARLASLEATFAPA